MDKEYLGNTLALQREDVAFYIVIQLVLLRRILQNLLSLHNTLHQVL